MNTKTLIVVLVVLVVGGGLWYYSGYQMPSILQDSIAPAHSDDPGSVKPDTRLVVGESIMGTWRSGEDARFVREFKDFSEASMTGNVVDYYNDEEVTTGTYSVAMEGDYVQVVLTMQGSQSETLTFRLNKLTPEALEMTYMDRGGVLMFSRVE